MRHQDPINQWGAKGTVPVVLPDPAAGQGTCPCSSTGKSSLFASNWQQFGGAVFSGSPACMIQGWVWAGNDFCQLEEQCGEENPPRETLPLCS